MKHNKYTTKDWNAHPDIEICPADIYNKYLEYKTDGFFVEFGMGGTLPPNASNTGDMADIGWSGLYFEPHPTNVIEGLRRHAGNIPRVKIIAAGVGDINEILCLFPGDTFREDMNKHYDSLGWLNYCNIHGTNYKNQYGRPECQILNVNEALKKYDCPSRFDLLSIDVEGYELKIIKTLDFSKYRPKLIVAELRSIHPYFPTEMQAEGVEFTDIITAKGYIMIHRDRANTWFLDPPRALE